MSAITDHARSMVAYNHWANLRILEAASNLSPEAFATVSGTLAHAVGTQLFWHANWHGQEFQEPERASSYDELRTLFENSDADFNAYAEALTDGEWDRVEAWWQRWGVDAKAPVGQTLFQVIYHGIQHRAEVAITLTEHGASPGDLDYLVYLSELAGVANR